MENNLIKGKEAAKERLENAHSEMTDLAGGFPCSRNHISKMRKINKKKTSIKQYCSKEKTSHGFSQASIKETAEQSKEFMYKFLIGKFCVHPAPSAGYHSTLVQQLACTGLEYAAINISGVHGCARRISAFDSDELSSNKTKSLYKSTCSPTVPKVGNIRDKRTSLKFAPM